ncbi:hypothetical protein NPIL_441551 [Nephila pilipes]|uniref:Uncharacterized protein n=1 Tax=Nephila pilipes TaxID=299642 RepID=A0A8X6N0F3_NEPPI|nr:hypothetical protein NPIL_441551 [Nephila pilipes]
MASSKVSREKLKRSGSFQKKEPPPPPPDENQFPDVKLEDFEMLKTIGLQKKGQFLCGDVSNVRFSPFCHYPTGYSAFVKSGIS